MDCAEDLAGDEIPERHAARGLGLGPCERARARALPQGGHRRQPQRAVLAGEALEAPVAAQHVLGVAYLREPIRPGRPPGPASARRRAR